MGFGLLIALLLPLVWMRAGAESRLWIDEIHSLQLSQLAVDRLLDESARDFHPPGYALALKLWIKIGRLGGLDPGLPWARALNVVVWLASAAAAWALGAAMLGRREGALLTLAVAGSAAAAVVVGDVRSYAFASCSLFLAVLLLAALRDSSRFGGYARWLWAAYGALLSVALWSHLLAAPVVALLGATWIACVAATPQGGTQRTPTWRLRPGLVAHAVPWLLFLPWLVEVPGQLAHLERTAPDWMTPASAGNLLRVFTWWLPLGRIGAPSPAAEIALSLLGGLAVAVPIAAGLGARRSEGPPGPASTLAALALPTAVGSVLLFWLLARLGIAATFHAPRYPLLVGGVLAAGLAGAALAGGRRVSRAAAALAFWIVAGLVGQALAIRQAAPAGGVAAFRPQVEALAAGTGGKLFVTPSELAPFVRRTFAGFDLRPIEELACSPPDAALVLDVNPWPALDRTRDLVMAQAIGAGLLAAGVDRRDFSDLQTSATLYRLEDLDRDLAAELCRRGFRPTATAPADAIAAAEPEDQLAGDGWSYLELEGLEARRWGTRPRVRIRFDRVVPPGSYLLHLRGARQPYPDEVATLAVRMAGTSLDAELPVAPGAIDLALPVEIERARRPVLSVGHPTWSPAAEMGSIDPRRLSFLFDAAWLAPAPAESSPTAR